MLEFSSTVLPAPSAYNVLPTVRKRIFGVKWYRFVVGWMHFLTSYQNQQCRSTERNSKQ